MNPLLRLSRLRPRKIMASILTVALLVSLTFFSLWYWASKRIEQIISRQFNEQQLMLARKIADNIEGYFDLLENELTSYADLYKVESDTIAHFRAYGALEFKDKQAFGILDMRIFNSQGRLEHSYGQTLKSIPQEAQNLDATYVDWAKAPEHRGMVFLTKTFLHTDPSGQQRLAMALMTPLYRMSSLFPEQNKTFAGILKIIFDPTFVSQMATKDVKSGQTGYAWVIDQHGTFLAHYEQEFVGQDSIKVRQKRNTKLSFDRLEYIQVNHILKGEEGTDWYESGWHREKIGKIKKLLAYTPVRFDKGMVRGIIQVEDSPHNLWAVGVAAPFEEVYGLVESLQVQVGTMAGFIFVLIVGMSGLLISASYNWNESLTREVELKTDALRQSHERLLRSERFAAVGEATAYVRHEIKNPLMIIGGFARQLDRNPHLPGSARQKLKIITDEVQRLENFLGDLRDFTQPACPVKQEADLNKIVREVQFMMQEAAEEKQIQLRTSLDDSVPSGQFDPNQMKQVLINLIKNAMEAMETEGSITVSTRRQGDQICIEVADTGKGIEPELMPEIFNPFFTTKKTGTGLGLAVINKIVEDHHGTVSVQSTQGKGTTFSILLPCQ
ncbi:hypothetical protein DSTSK_01820 [Desulforhabdus sp. TSK]|nr:hypothetical protein DSTSK_01820 [Desulforhabdus sp. TSK]